MIKIPFDRDTFAEQAKQRISGINVTLNYDNIESGLIKSGVEIQKVIGEKTYLQLNNITDEANDPARDALQRAMLHMTINDQLIFLIARISNDGVTVKKNDDETTIFKYQEDALRNALINTTWFWMDYLIKTLNNDPAEGENTKYPDWHTSGEKKEFSSMPVSQEDFRKWLGIDNAYFVARTKWLILSTTINQLNPRIKDQAKWADHHESIARAVCFSVMAQACLRLPYDDLPENIRKDIDNEQSKSNKTQAEPYIRDRISTQFFSEAERYWADLDRLLQGEKQIQRRPIRESQNNESNKFYHC